MINTNLFFVAVFILMSAAIFFFLRLDYALLDWITSRAERKAKIKSFKKQSRLSRLVDRLLAKCASLITNSQMPKTAYYILTVACAVGGFFAGKTIFSSMPIALAVGTFGMIAPLLFFSFRQTKAKTAQDNFAAEIINELGTYNIAENAKALLDGLSLEEIVAENPEYIFISIQGSEEAAKKHIQELFASDGWKDLNAVKNSNYVFLPKDLFHYKPNARWAEAYKYAADILYPELNLRNENE